MTEIPNHIAARIIEYPDRFAWVADGGYGAPHFRMGGTSMFDALERPWSRWSDSHSWTADDALRAEESRPVDDGVKAEPFILSMLAERHGFRVIKAGSDKPFRLVHPDYPWLRPSPDAICWCPSRGLGVVDPKTRWDRQLWPDDGAELEMGSAAMFDAVPEPKYVYQMAAQIDSGPFDWGALAVGLHFRDIRLIVIRPNPEKQRRVLAKVADWRERHLVGGVEPKYDASREAVNWTAARLREIRRDATEAEESLAYGYLSARDAEKAAKAQADSRKAALVKSMAEAGGHKTLILSDGGRVTVAKNGRLSVKPGRDEE